MSAAFGWDAFFSGLVLSAFWAGYALTQVLGGRLADRYGGWCLISPKFSYNILACNVLVLTLLFSLPPSFFFYLR